MLFFLLFLLLLGVFLVFFSFLAGVYFLDQKKRVRMFFFTDVSNFERTRK